MALHLKFLRGFRSFIYRQELSSDSAASHFRIPCSYFAFFFFFILKFDYWFLFFPEKHPRWIDLYEKNTKWMDPHSIYAVKK